jgi:predicted enzyme related to lactoylglutathione lyase
MAYVYVENVDATVGRAERNGGKVLFGPLDVPEVGRFAIIADPEGAAIAAFTPQADAPSGEGIFVWDELLSRDVEGAKRFYTEVFGWTLAQMDMGELGGYTLFKRAEGEADAGGLMAMPPGVEAPPSWLTYLGTDDVDATVERARALGAAVLNPGADIPGGGASR